MNQAVDQNPKNLSEYLKFENEKQYNEWEKTRGIFTDYDNRLHELRKYGFTFVTALLTAGAFITKAITSSISQEVSVSTVTASGSTTTETSTPIPGIFNLGVFVVTLMLIVALHLLDKNYRVFQQAAYTRATVLERKLNLELSETIAVRHRSDNIDNNVLFVYMLFVFGVFVLGFFVCYPEWNLIIGLISSTVIAVGVIIYQNIKLRLQFRNTKMKEDWTVSPIECTQDEEIKIILNNFNKDSKGYDKPIIFSGGHPIWEIKNGLGGVVYQCKPLNDMTVYNNQVWIIKPNKFDDNGIEQVYRLQPRDWDAPLPISIIVHKSNSSNINQPKAEKNQ
jgi:hypothetical protein